MKHVSLGEENCGVFGSLPKQEHALNHGCQLWIRCQNDLMRFPPQWTENVDRCYRVAWFHFDLPCYSVCPACKITTRFIAKPEEMLAKLLERTKVLVWLMFSLVPEIVPVGTPSMWPQTAKVQLQVLRDIILYGIYLINVTLVFFSSHEIFLQTLQCLTVTPAGLV